MHLNTLFRPLKHEHTLKGTFAISLLRTCTTPENSCYIGISACQKITQNLPVLDGDYGGRQNPTRHFYSPSEWPIKHKRLAHLLHTFEVAGSNLSSSRQDWSTACRFFQCLCVFSPGILASFQKHGTLFNLRLIVHRCECEWLLVSLCALRLAGDQKSAGMARMPQENGRTEK